MRTTSPQKTRISRVVVRPFRTWQFYLAAGIVCSSLIFLLAWAMYETGKHSESTFIDVSEENSGYSFDPGVCRQTKKRQLCTQIGDLTQQLQIGNTASQDLAEQVKSLAQENDQLKEKLAFFQHLVANNAKNGISIYQFSLKETQIPGKYRYALTLIQNGERPNDFKGSLKFQVKLSQNGQSKLIPLVNKNSLRNFPVEFKFLHRLEESFMVPPDTSVENIQVQVFKEGNNSKAILSETVPPSLQRRKNMFGRKRKNQLHHHIDTLIGANTKLTGDIHFTGGLRIDGHITGNVIAAGGEHDTLVLSNEGSITGKISVANVVINGTVNGPVHAPSYLELQESAKVYGDVQYGLLEIHLGASVQGKMIHQHSQESDHAKNADKMIPLIPAATDRQQTPAETVAK